MKRVASLYLPHWSIDRVLRAERRHAPPPEPVARDSAVAESGAAADATEPRTTGWRPGARWARADLARQIAALPAHQRPSTRDLAKRIEMADHPFRAMPPDEGRTVVPTSLPARVARCVQAVTAPSNKGARPLVTVQKIGSRVQIAAASPAALALGLTPGMALTQARASVPDIDVRDADPDGDRADLERLAVALARRWTPIVAISDPDGLFLDLTGVAHLHGGEAAMMRRIVRLLARLGVTARIAVADTAGAAWALARFAALRQADLMPLPIAALRLDEASRDLLKRLGIDRIGQLAEIPRAPLVRRFGPDIARRLDQALGRAPEPLDPVIPPIAIRAERRFAEPIATADAIGHWLAGLVADLTTELAKTGQGARTLLFAAERVDATVQTFRIGLARPTRDPAHILRLILRRIEEIDPGYGIDALALHVRRADPLGPEELCAQIDAPDSPDLAPLVDTLANRIGARGLWRIRPIESDVPERSLARLAPLDPPGRIATILKLDDVRRLDERPQCHPWHPRWPRPVRLLHRPERIDHVLAELPDQPPRRFTWRGVRHDVVRADGPERITGEWWRRSAERDAVRDYFAVENACGHRFWLFRRGDGVRAETGDLSWFIHGAFA